MAQRLPLADDLYVVDARSRATDRELHVIATGPQLPITGARDARCASCLSMRVARTG